MFAYLQPISSDVDVAHPSRHFFPFENFGCILDADDKQHTHIAGLQKANCSYLARMNIFKWVHVCVCEGVCLTPGPEAPGLR